MYISIQYNLKYLNGEFNMNKTFKQKLESGFLEEELTETYEKLIKLHTNTGFL